MRICEYHYKTT